MKSNSKPKAFRLTADAAALLEAHSEKTGKSQTLLIERAIMRCYAKKQKKD